MPTNHRSEPDEQRKKYLNGLIEDLLKVKNLPAEKVIERGVTIKKYAIELNDPRRLGTAYAQMGIGYGRLAQYDRSIELFRKAVTEYESVNDDFFVVRVLIELSVSLAFQGKTEEGYVNCLLCCTKAEQLGQPILLYKSYLNISSVLSTFGENERAAKYLQDAYKIIEEKGDSWDKQQVLHGLSQLFKSQEDFERALTYASQALGVNEPEQKHLRGTLLNQSAKLLQHFLRWDESLEQATIALNIFEEIGEPVGQALALQNQSKSYFGKNNQQKAEECILRAYDLVRSIGKSRELPSIMMEYGRLKAHQGMIEVGVSLIKGSMAESERHEWKEDIIQAHMALYDVYKMNNQTSAALSEFEDAVRIRNEIQKERVQMRLRVFEIEQGIEEERKHMNEIKNKSERLESELANTTLHLVAQTELLSELRDDLLKVIRKFPMPDGAAKELRERLKALPCKSVDWDRFDTQFKAAHPEFTKKLLEAHPTLSPTELRICSLLRMNLRSAEIARLFCLSERTVEDHRANIRKKMKLKRSEDLIAYLARL